MWCVPKEFLSFYGLNFVQFDTLGKSCSLQGIRKEGVNGILVGEAKEENEEECDERD